MTRLNGLDANHDVSNYAAALKKKGFDFVIRYYSHNTEKNLSLPDAVALSRAGLQIGAVWETTGTHASFFNLAQGLADGAAAYALAKQKIGQPDGSAIYFAVDYDASANDIVNPISDYFRGIQKAFQAASVDQPSYKVGVYGSGDCCDSLLKNHLAQLSWLSQSTGFSGSVKYATTLQYNLIQYLPKDVPLSGDRVIRFDLDSSNEGKPTGLFMVSV